MIWEGEGRWSKGDGEGEREANGGEGEGGGLKGRKEGMGQRITERVGKGNWERGASTSDVNMVEYQLASWVEGGREGEAGERSGWQGGRVSCRVVGVSTS